MTRVDFYLLGHDNLMDVTCRLVDKAYQRGHRLFIYTQSMPEAERIDEALWTFRDDSFIPHLLQEENLNPPPPVQIGIKEPSFHFSDIVINLSESIPPWFKRFQRILELVPNEESAKLKCRERYKLYRQSQFELQTHSL